MLVIDPRADASIRPYNLPGVGFSVFYAFFRCASGKIYFLAMTFLAAWAMWAASIP